MDERNRLNKKEEAFLKNISNFPYGAIQDMRQAVLFATIFRPDEKSRQDYEEAKEVALNAGLKESYLKRIIPNPFKEESK